ncbi:YdcH family protein [Pseudomonas sp. 5P_3.1_Bac2]|uniref:YdcH family protein n=1 Tax=Pseudomonas sp. 5P_3.1_Bac2 TaxID=2971617 RepID=UPI0021C680B6|nr:YdcH family protein [Pseudomonas sp. 5P_3.1_Bac2]MCU1718202.1 YdcH family protein [Pseudomonas sp. 5P_3.1_Bac2]
MPLEHHPLHREFPEYRTALLNLLSHDGHFARLAAEYEQLDKRIFEAEDGRENLDDMHLLGLKMQRVSLKDELADLLRKAS